MEEACQKAAMTLDQADHFLNRKDVKEWLADRAMKSYIKNEWEVPGKLYKELDDIETEEKLLVFATSLRDRFGPVPPQVFELMNTIRLRWKARLLGFEKIVLKHRTLKTYFINNQQSAYFQSALFASVLRFVQAHPRLCKMKEEKGKLSLTLIPVDSIEEAYRILDRMVNYDKVVV